MNAADLARLELAKRAYKAAEPSEAEVQTGVRRARLWLGRPKPRRTWLSKGLVLVVLAVGSLAYARPQAAGELVEKVLRRDDAPSARRLRSGVVLAAPIEAVMHRGAPASTRDALLPSHRDDDPVTDRVTKPRATTTTTTATARRAGPPNANASQTAAASQPTPPKTTEGLATTSTKSTGALTDWGRVGQALARGDSAQALSALGELAESDDPSTRDKADLGRAQLLMAHGEPDQACALARSLTHRRAGGRIERQAQLLLKGCASPNR